MPFPFAVLGPIIAAAGTVASTVAAGAAVVGAAAAAAAPFVAGGAAILGGLAITGAIIESNEKKRRSAREAAEAAASRAREQEALRQKKELERKINNLNAQYGSNIPTSKKEELLLESSEILGTLEGNKAGLQKKGIKESPEAEAAIDELMAMQAKCGLKR